MSAFTLPEDMNGFRIHFVGIKGTGMTALVEICVARGAVITGSDVPDRFYTDDILESLNISVITRFSASNITDDVQLVIYSAAYKVAENPDLAEAVRRNLPVILYSEALGSISASAFSCGIAGVHGKTTTTGMCGTIIKELNLPAQVLAGSVISSFDNTCTLSLGHKYFIAETCEYQRHFMSFHPSEILLTSVESDHQDYYPTYESILAAFVQYVELLPDFSEVFYCADDPGACEAVTVVYADRPDLVYTGYGESAVGDYKIEFRGVRNERQVFTLAGLPGEFRLQVPGRHNVRNAAGAAALALSLVRHEYGEVTRADIEKVRQGLLAFRGAKRRCEILGSARGILFIDDYGHHPTAIATTLAGLREFYPDRRIVVDFMSHTYSRTAALLEEFASCFSSADEVVLHKIYASAREIPDGRTSGELLYRKTQLRHPHVSYYDEVMDASEYLVKTLKEGDLFVTMGAGDNWKLGRYLLDTLSDKS